MSQELFDFSTMTKGLDLSPYSTRQKIEIIEWIIANEMDNIADELPVNHYVHGGMYYREMSIPQGVVLTGKIHLVDHIFILLKGELSIMTDDGIKRIIAPCQFPVRAGIKKIGYAHSDVECTTIHATKKKNLDKIEKELFDNGNISWVNDLMKSQGLLQ